MAARTIAQIRADHAKHKTILAQVERALTQTNISPAVRAKAEIMAQESRKTIATLDRLLINAR